MSNPSIDPSIPLSIYLSIFLSSCSFHPRPFILVLSSSYPAAIYSSSHIRFMNC